MIITNSMIFFGAQVAPQLLRYNHNKMLNAANAKIS